MKSSAFTKIQPFLEDFDGHCLQIQVHLTVLLQLHLTHTKLLLISLQTARKDWKCTCVCQAKSANYANFVYFLTHFDETKLLVTNHLSLAATESTAAC